MPPDSDSQLRCVPAASAPVRSRHQTGAAVFWIAALALVVVRFAHLDPVINEPHAWRQMDTAQYIRSFAEKRGLPDLLHPSVSWMGNHRTLILEFPLPEAIAAITLRALGAAPEDLIVPRLIFLAGFLLSAHGLWLIAAEFLGATGGRWTVFFYLASPLAQAYSRAIHIDFVVLALSHWTLFCWMRGLRTESSRWVWLGVLPATLAALIKAPCLFPGLFVLIPFAWMPNRRRFLFRTAPALLVPLGAFVWWRLCAESVNAGAPDWSFIPEYHRFVGMTGWYFGPLRQRLQFEAWRSIASVSAFAVIGLAALPLAAVGASRTWAERRDRPGLRAVIAWVLGSALYVLLFFNLNVVHDYYELPLVAPAAVLAGLGADHVCARTNRRWMEAVITIIVAATNTAWAEGKYYQPVGITAAAGTMIRAHTPEDSLIVASWPQADPRSPHLLFAAHRYGWSVRSKFLTHDLVERLRQQGATHLALLRPSSAAGLRVGRDGKGFKLVDYDGNAYVLTVQPLVAGGAP